MIRLLIWSVAAHPALYTTRRIAAASLFGAGVLLAQVVTVSLYKALLLPGPVLAAHLLLVPPAIALDTWYALRSAIRDPRPLWWVGALLYGLVFFAVAFLYLGQLLVMPWLDSVGRLEAVAVGLPAALIGSLISAWLGDRLRDLARAPAEAPVARAGTSVSGPPQSARG